MKEEIIRGADPLTPRLVPQVMTAQEAAEVLNVSLSTIYNLRDRGTLPQLTKLPGVRFAAKDVMDLIGVDTYFYTPQKMNWRERVKPEPTDYLTFEHVVYTGDSLWSLCERYSGYEDLQTIIMRVREDNGICNPGALQPGQKIKVRVRKGNR